MDPNENVSVESLQLALQAERDRADRLEVMLFAFIYNRTTYPVGKALGKTDDEILIKTVEIMRAASGTLDFEKAKERFVRACDLEEEERQYDEDE